jgi:hypothetical protein
VTGENLLEGSCEKAFSRVGLASNYLLDITDGAVHADAQLDLLIELWLLVLNV